MKKVQLLEFKDCSWFLTHILSYMSNLIVHFQQKLGIDEVLVNLTAEILKEKDISQIVDLKSASGGAMRT